MSIVPFEKAVQVYGTDKMRLQCYLRMVEASNAQSLEFLDDTWEKFNLSEKGSASVEVLLEKSTACLKELAQEAIFILIWASRQSSIRVAALIFDGGFSGGGDLFSDSSFNQVYGISGNGIGPILTLDRNVMMSSEWKYLLNRIKRNNDENQQQWGESDRDCGLEKRFSTDRSDGITPSNL